ncbi:MAG: hypothetical protein QXJ48_00320 [Candidatus Korarchaeum sp.]
MRKSTLASDASSSTTITEWYRGAGNIRSVKRGLDNRSFIIDLSGRREMRVLAVIYDPSTDDDLQEFVESLLDSYRRARIGFDRLDIWVPAPLYSRAQDLMEEAERRGLSWTSKVSLRSLTAPGDLGNEGIHEGRVASPKRSEGVKGSPNERKPEPSRELRESKEVSLLIREVGREIGEGIARSLEESLRSILSSIDVRRSDSELILRIHELERRIELLESFIRILGNYGASSVPQIPREVPQVKEQLRPSRIAEEGRSKVEEVSVNIRNVDKSEEALESSVSTDDLLAEIFNNPWVSILRKKGDHVEGEGD